MQNVLAHSKYADKLARQLRFRKKMLSKNPTIQLKISELSQFKKSLSKYPPPLPTRDHLLPHLPMLLARLHPDLARVLHLAVPELVPAPRDHGFDLAPAFLLERERVVFVAFAFWVAAFFPEGCDAGYEGVGGVERGPDGLEDGAGGGGCVPFFVVGWC